ncbi:HAMP domain-containing histidine kinase [Mucilaginibacter roseus]|uniref:histidine kinase n=1 Tax=Mucilaginibacter roseus TaxID=1528868 RepID=A0ABS8U338_9SPHI|nr:HAMP domain-containing sensor histidine kinase [Mucilaginibacter roseus]MCD8741516.1 HAMP domain-containing histidine kinase [Mucilaginibacter roseus]
MKLQTKITLLFLVISAVGLLLMNAAIFYFVSDFNFEDFFKRLEARVRFAAQIKIHPDGRTAAYREAKTKNLEMLEGERDFVVRVNSDGSFKRPLNLPDEFYTTILNGNRARYDRKNHFYAGSLFITPYGKYVVIAEAIDPYGYKELNELRKILIIIFFISVILAYVAGRVFSYYALKPIRNLIRSVKNISANNLHMRVDETGRDEIAELVSTFNHMLNRLETAFETQNNFVSNASHELRTPLSIISGETELLLARKGLDADAIANVNTILHEAEKLENILASLLGLAQSGFDGKKQNWQLIRADELVITAVESVKKIATECTIDIDFSALPENDDQLQTEGNMNLLHLAVSNIIMNACKYSSNQPVTVKIVSQKGTIKISVIDKGIGIPKQEQKHVFEPFFRASNTGKFEGYGIGLPLTLNIIKLHQGSINIISEEQMGTEIQVMLPVAE